MSTDPRDAAIESSLKRTRATVPDKVVEDLKYFAEKAKAGRAISIAALLQYMEDHNQFKVARYRLHTIAKANGITPWWSV